MSARDRIDAAVVIAKAVMATPVVLGSEGTAKAIAVALESESLLVDSACAEADVRNKVALEIVASIDAHQAEHPFAHAQFRAGMREALRIVLGSDAPDTSGSPGDLFDPPDPAGGDLG